MVHISLLPLPARIAQVLIGASFLSLVPVLMPFGDPYDVAEAAGYADMDDNLGLGSVSVSDTEAAFWPEGPTRRRTDRMLRFSERRRLRASSLRDVLGLEGA